MAKAPRVRRYAVRWRSLFCGFKRGLTVRAANKQQAAKLVADRYPAQRKHHVECLK